MIKCEVEPNDPTCSCMPPCGAQCVVSGCGSVAATLIQGAYVLGDDVKEFANKDFEAWVCSKCAKKLLGVK